MTVSTLTFNLNSYVWVKLTDKGHEVHMRNHFNSIGGHIDRYPHVPPAVDANGWSKFHLWELMNIFGPACYNGCKPPFETTIALTEPDA